MCWMLSLTDSKMKSLQVQSLKLRLCEKKSSLFFFSVFCSFIWYLFVKFDRNQVKCFCFFTAAHTFNPEAPNEEKFVPDRWKKDNESVFVCDLKLSHQQFVRFAAQNLFSSQSSDPSCVLDSESWTFISSLLSVTCWLVEKSGNLFFFFLSKINFHSGNHSC